MSKQESDKAPKAPTSHKGRTILGGTLATGSVLVAFAIAIGANLVASQLSVRVDMTDNHIYTLDQISKDAAKKLTEPITVKVFISPDLPPPFHTAPQTVSDVLDEYVAASDGKLTYSVVSPKDNDDVEKAAQGYGCEKVAIGQQSENEVSLRAVYKCVAFVQGERHEVLRDLRLTGNPATDNLEYDFTKALLNLSTTKSRKVGFARGLGGPVNNPGFADSARGIFTRLYGNLIEPADLDLTVEDPKIPEDMTAILIIDAANPPSPKAKFAIDQFIQRGGSVGWFQSSTEIDLGATQNMQQQLQQQGQAPDQNIPKVRFENKHELNDLFGTYGVVHKGGLVLDREHALALGMVMTERGPVQISHPATFQINELDRTLPFLTKMPPVALPAPGYLEITEAARKNDKLKIYEALKTSDKASLLAKPPVSFMYKTLVDPSKDELPGQYLLGVAMEGTFPSYYTDNPLPEGVKPEQRHTGEAAPGRLLVLSSGAFLQPDTDIGYDGELIAVGQQLMFNAIEWLAQDTSLSGIRTKTMPSFVGEVSASTQRRVQFVNIIFVPACFIMLGVFMYLRRQRRRDALKR